VAEAAAETVATAVAVAAEAAAEVVTDLNRASRVNYTHRFGNNVEAELDDFDSTTAAQGLHS
jgi:hypothetical protein